MTPYQVSLEIYDGLFYWGITLRENELLFRCRALLVENPLRCARALTDFIRRGPGYNRCIMGLTKQDPYIQKEHTELYKFFKFRVNWTNIEQDTAIQKLYNLQRNVFKADRLQMIVVAKKYICVATVHQ